MTRLTMLWWNNFLLGWLAHNICSSSSTLRIKVSAWQQIGHSYLLRNSRQPGFSKHVTCAEVTVLKYGRTASADTHSRLEMTAKWEWYLTFPFPCNHPHSLLFPFLIFSNGLFSFPFTLACPFSCIVCTC